MKTYLILLISLLAFIALRAQSFSTFNGPVYALKVYRYCVVIGDSRVEYKEVIAGGKFTQAGGVAVTNIARWNGTAWEPLGNGLSGPVYAIEAVSRDGNNDPRADIYAGGIFGDKGHVARWNPDTGTWASLGVGVTSSGFHSTYKPDYVVVKALRFYNGYLWVGGRFLKAGGVERPNIARWQRSTLQWHSVGQQTFSPCDGQTTFGPGIRSPFVEVSSIDPSIAAIGVLKTNSFQTSFHVPTPEDSEGFYLYNHGSDTFTAQCRPPIIRAVDSGNGVIYAGHTNAAREPWGVPADWPFDSMVARESGVSQLMSGSWRLVGYNGAALPPFGSSPWGDASSESGWKTIGPVYAIAHHNGDVYFGGSFTNIVGAYAGQRIASYSPVNNIFKWNPAFGWTALGSGSDPCVPSGANGVNGPIYAIDVDFNACEPSEFRGVWVAGSFTQAGGKSASNIAFWDVANQRWETSEGNQRPFATVTSVTAGTHVLSGTTLQGYWIDATACDSDGSVASVDFYANNVLIGRAANPAQPRIFWQPSVSGSYQITALATDNEGLGAVSFRLFFSATAPAAPAAPSGLTLSVPAANQVRLTWIDNSGDESGFYVERSADGGAYTRIHTASWNVTTFTDSPLSPNVNYSYRVQAFHAGAASAYSVMANIMNHPTICVSRVQDGTEAGTRPRFRISRPAADSRNVTVNFSVSGTATSGSDFQSMGNAAVIQANQVSVDVEAIPFEDSLYEGTETIQMTLTAGTGYAVGCTPAVANLADNEPLPTISVSGASFAAEGGQNGYFYVVPSVTIQRPLTIYFTLGGTAIAGSDYQNIGGSFSIPGGTAAGSYASIPVTAINDTIFEATETLNLTLTPNSAYNSGGGVATVKILDNEAETIYVVANDGSASEAGGNTGQFTVFREGGSAYAYGNPLTVSVSYSGLAANGVDYQILSTSITIPANLNYATLTVTPINDAVYEGAETVIATLSRPNQSVYVGGTPGTINIADDEPLPTIFPSAYMHGVEGANNAHIVFYSNVAFERSITIYYSVSGSATAGVDYTGPTGTFVLTGPRAASSYSGVSINVIDDNGLESTETVTFTLIPTSAYTISPTSPSATANITDNDW